ncbi:MAG: DUF2723 domain-containing protein, partial [Myxococcota bacterium]|nr:DUF2723 domain-containing protein [Myxococcota bacterium]
MEPTPQHRFRELHPVGLRGPAIASVAALAFYFFSVDSSPFWGDSASFASHLDTSPKPFARSYWLYKSLGRLLVFFGAEPALAANLASAIFGAASVGTVWAVVQRLTGKAFAATGAAASLAVAHTFWFHSSVAEVYSLHALFELLLIYFALGASRRARDAMALGFVAGLALNHHRLIYFSLAALLPFLALELRGRAQRAAWGRLALGLCLGALPWLALCLRFPPSALEPPVGITAGQLWLQKTFFGG